MIGAISEALALAETPNTLIKARAAAETADTTRVVRFFEETLLI
jgi:hypothetical protein